MTRFNNNNSNNNESSSSSSTITATTATTMVTTDVASSSSSSTSTSSATTNIVAAATLATQSSSTTTTTIHAKTSTTTTMAATMATTATTTTAMMIERPPTVTLIGQPCGHHGSYTFYKAFKYCSTANQLERVLMLGEFFFVRISPQDDPCIGELQLLWEDHQNHQLLSSTRLYFLPEQTPEGRLSHHGQHEVLAAQDKVILKLTDLVTWITHQVDWLAGMPYKWQPSTPTPSSTSTYCPSSSTSDDDDPPLSSTSSSSSSSTIATLAGKKLNENKDNVPVVVAAAENNGDDEEKTMKTKEKKNSSEKQAQQQQQQQWLQQRKMLSSLAFIHNQNVIPPNGSKPFLTSQRFINDKCKILFKTAPPRPPPTTTSKSTAPPTTSAAAQQNNATTAINRNSNNIDEATTSTSTNTSVMDQPPPPPHHPARQPQPQRYCRSFTCSRVDFSDIIPSKLRSNELQDDLSSVVVLSYNKYCRYRNLLKRIEGKEKDYLVGQRMVQDVLIELGIPQQRNSNVNILFCRDTFNHEALLNNDLNCDHLAPKLKGRKRKRPRLKTIRRASSPDSDSPAENGRLFSPRRTRRTTAASTLASNLLNQFMCDQRKKPKNNKNKTTTSNNNKTGKNQQRSNKNYNNDSSDQEDDKNCEDGGGGSAVMMVELNQNTSDENDHHDDGRMKLTKIDKENKPSNTKNNGNMNCGNNKNNHTNNNNENGGGGQRAEGDDDNTKNKTDSSSTVDANNNIDKYKEQEQQKEEKDIIIVVDRKDVVAAPKDAATATGGGGGGGESDSDWDWDFNGQDDGDNHDIKFNRKRFLKELNKFMKQRKTPIKRVPFLGFKKIDLFQFYTQARKFGGYEQLTKKRLWKKLYDKMGGDKHCTSAATSTRRQYEKLLLPFDRHLRGLPDIHRKRKRSEDFMEESDDVDGELSSNFSETDSSSTITTNSSSKDNDDSDTRSVKSRGETKTKTEAKAEQPQPQPKVDPDVIVTTAPPATNTNTTMIKGIQSFNVTQFNQSCRLSECDEKMDVKVMDNNNNNDVVVNHLAVGGLTPTVEEIDIKLIPITDSKNVECWKKKEKEMKLFRDLSPASTTTTTTSARPSKTVPPNENILISVRSEDKPPPPTKKDDQSNNNNNNNKTTKNINAVLPLLSNTNSHQNKMTALVHPTQRRCEVLNNNNNDATTTAAAGDVYDFTDLNPLEQQEQQQKEELLLLKSFESNKKHQQQQQPLQQRQALKNVNPDNKSSRLKGGPSPFHSIANLVNNNQNNNKNDRLVVPVVPASPETAVVVKQAAKPTTVGGIIPLSPPIDDSHSSINNKNISGLDNNPTPPPPPTATTTLTSANAVKKKNILLQKSLENSAHHHHLHHPPTTTGYRPPTPINNNSGGGDLKLMETKPRRMVVQSEPLPAHSYNILQARATTSFGTTTTKRKRFNNIATDEILDLSMKKHFHEADSRTTTITTTMNVNSFPVDNGGRWSTSTSNQQQQQQQSNNNNVRDGILLDLSTANNNSKKNNNKLNSTTTNSTTTKQQQPKLPTITPKVSHQVFVQENPCSITAAAAVEPAGNLIWKKNPIQPPKDVVVQRPKRPSIISLEGEETMIVRPVDAPQKARSYKALPRQINKTKPSNKTAAAAATNHFNNNMNNNKTSVIQPKPSISEYNPSLPQFIGSHLWNNWNPFQMQTATPPTPFPSGAVPIIPPTAPPTTTATATSANSVHHHHHTSPPPPQSSFNTAAAVHSNMPASIMPQSILSSFPNYDTRSSSSSSLSLDRNSLAMLEQIRMLQACQLKNNFQMGQNPFFNPDLLANYNLANILASSISSAASSSSSK